MPTTVIVNVGSGGANHIVAASSVPTGFCVRVLAWQLSFGSATNAKWQSSGGTDLTGTVQATTNTQVNSPSLGAEANRGQFQTLKNEGLDLNLSSGVSTTGYVVYEFVGQ
jgi:hypothetical protein